MASTQYAVAQMKKAGAEVTTEDNRHFIGQFEDHSIEVTDQNGEAILIYVIGNGCEDDLMTDYFAGSFASNIKRAIEWVI